MNSLLFLSLLLFEMSFSTQKVDLVVQLSNLKRGKGSVNVALYRTAEDFTDNPYKTLSQKLKTGQSGASLTFESVEPGEYAIAVYQDLNENGILDTNFAGIPQEPYGFSNNYRPTISLPSFAKAKFKLSGDKIVQQIKIE